MWRPAGEEYREDLAENVMIGSGEAVGEEWRRLIYSVISAKKIW
jgi:hypothetical protein